MAEIKGLRGPVRPREATLQTVALPQVGQGNPTAIAHSFDAPCRVVVSNVSAAVVNLAFSVQAIQGPDGLTGDLFQLFPAQQQIFLMSEKQILYANASAPNGRVSVHISDAWPTEDVGRR